MSEPIKSPQSNIQPPAPQAQPQELESGVQAGVAPTRNSNSLLRNIVYVLSLMGLVSLLFWLIIPTTQPTATAPQPATGYLPIVMQQGNPTIESIVTQVNGYCADGQIKDAELCNSLLAKLAAAIESRDRGQPNTACHQLDAFMREVGAQKNNKITSAATNRLIESGGRACEVIFVTSTPMVSPTPTVSVTTVITDGPTATIEAHLGEVIMHPTSTAAPTPTPTPTYPPVQYPLVVQAAGRYEFSEPKPILEGHEDLFLMDWTADSQHFLVWRETENGRNPQILDLQGQVVTDFGSWGIIDANMVISSDDQMIAFTIYNTQKDAYEFIVVDKNQQTTVVLEKPHGFGSQPYGDVLWVIDDSLTIIQYKNLQTASQRQEQQKISLSTYYNSEQMAKWKSMSFHLAINPVNPNQAIIYLDQEFLVVDLTQQTIKAIDLGEKDFGPQQGANSGLTQYWISGDIVSGAVKWSPDGNHVVAKTTAGERPVRFSDLTLFDTTNWSYQRFDMPGLGYLNDMSWTPNNLDLFLSVASGKSASGKETHKRYILNIVNQEMRLILFSGKELVGYGMRWSPDGTKVQIPCTTIPDYEEHFNQTGERFVKKCLMEVQ